MKYYLIYYHVKWMRIKQIERILNDDDAAIHSYDDDNDDKTGSLIAISSLSL